MRAPIDDERVRQWIARMRAGAFAMVSGLVGAGVVHTAARGYPEVVHPARGWVAVVTTAGLAWWAVRGVRSLDFQMFLRPTLAGALNGLLHWIVLAVSLELAHHQSIGTTVAGAFGAGVGGLVCGGGFTMGLGVLWLGLDGLDHRPSHTTLPWALFVTALWCTVGFAFAALVGRLLPGGSIVAVVLACASALVAVGALVEMAQRRAFAGRAERGELASWRVEEDDDGTRWLVREERGGDGAYREGAMSTRWGRIGS